MREFTISELDVFEEVVPKLEEPASRVDAAAGKCTLAGLKRLTFRATTDRTDGVFRVIVELSYSSGDSLRRVNLIRCDINQAVVEGLALCADLTFLTLAFTNMEDHHLEAILSGTQKLEELNLNSCERIRDRGCEAIGRLQNLRRLSLDYCAPSSAGLCRLQNLKDLQRLHLSCIKCNLEMIHALKTLKELTELKLSECQEICDECVMIICDNFTNLKTLHLSLCSEITDTGFSQLHKLHALRDLTLSGVPLLFDRVFEKGVGPIGLITLNLSGNWGTTGASLVNVATHHQALEDLDLS